MTIFMDDLSMPEVNTWGDQPTLEMVRLIVEYGGFCFLDKDKRGDLKHCEDLQFVAAMSSGSGTIPARLKRHFFVFNFTQPSTQSLGSIFNALLGWRFAGSLTTPGCTEGVSWIVMKQPVLLSAAQLAAFKGAYDNNARPVQPLNGRPITEDTSKG
jgi:hypothetical protein